MDKAKIRKIVIAIDIIMGLLIGFKLIMGDFELRDLIIPGILTAYILFMTKK